MANRNRAQYGYHTGYSGPTSPPTSPRTETSMSSVCDDVVLPGDNQYFNVHRYTRSGGLVNGRRGSAIAGYTYYTDWPGSNLWTGTMPISHLSVSSQTNSYYASTVLSRTNPSRSSVNALVNAIELRELPGLIKDTYSYRLSNLLRSGALKGFRFLPKAAKLNLLVQFGILPLLGDLSTLTQFQSLVDARMREIDRLRTRGLRRTVDCDTNSAHYFDGNYITFSASGTNNIVRSNLTRVTTLTVRGHVRWHVSFGFPQSDDEMRRRVTKAVAGLDVNPSTIYELIPWTWLIDYFTNLGNIVKAVDNTIGAHHGQVMIMRNTRTECTIDNTRQGSTTLSVSPGRSTIETKSRVSASPSLSASLDLLTPGQMSILGSLSVLKL